MNCNHGIKADDCMICYSRRMKLVSRKQAVKEEFIQILVDNGWSREDAEGEYEIQKEEDETAA